MRVIFGLPEADSGLTAGVLSIGNFDGVHRGHQAIIARAAARARARAGPCIVLTFEPHALSVVRPHDVPPVLTPLDEKAAQLSAHGADAVVVVRPDPPFLSLSPDEFARRVLVDRFRVAAVVEGPSFRYGHRRAGDVETLRQAGARYGFEVEVVDPIEVDVAPGGFEVEVVDPIEVDVAPGRREPVSSSLVRRAVAGGDIELARRALGRPYALLGVIVEGRGRGREIGYPTANLATGQLLPLEGVYAGSATVAGRTWPAAISIGRAPTFGDTDVLVEAHLVDFSGSLYGQQMRLEVHTRLRPQETCGSVEELRSRIEQDVAAVRRMRA